MTMMAPGNMNIRRIGFPIQQRWDWGVPVVHTGDWLAQRPVAGHGPRLVYYRQPWEVSPIVRIPARPLPAGVALGTNGDDTYSRLFSTFSDIVGGGREEVEQSIADRASASMMDQMRPYLIWGGLGLAGLVVFVGFASFVIGRSAR